MSSYAIVITAGFAMFSMFFGSGNLVFPLEVGTETLHRAPWAMVGLGLSGVVMPFMGLIGVILYSGNRANYFACIGKYPALVLTFFILAMMGPVGVIPRCILVAHGGISLFAPGFEFWLFSIIFCAVTGVLVWKHNRVVPILGRVLTPGLLVGIVTVIIAGIFFSDLQAPISPLTEKEAFWKGFDQGFQTMDLLAAFFFSATTVAFLKSHMRSDDSPSRLFKLSLYSSLIGAGLLGFIYLAFVSMGAEFAMSLEGVAPQQMLAAIAGETLGPIAIPVVSVTVALACLTTATILVMLFSDFVNEDICRGKFGAHKAVVLTLVASYVVSMVGFEGLRSWIGTVLEVAYPALIVLTVANIGHMLFQLPVWCGRWGFWVTAVIVAFVQWVVPVIG